MTYSIEFQHDDFSMDDIYLECETSNSGNITKVVLDVTPIKETLKEYIHKGLALISDQSEEKKSAAESQYFSDWHKMKVKNQNTIDAAKFFNKNKSCLLEKHEIGVGKYSEYLFEID